MITTPRVRPTLGLARIPGPFGPILRCSGELSVATVEPLRREMALLLPMGHRALTLSLSGCSLVDAEGILAILRVYKEMRRNGTRLVLVGGTGRTERLLHFMAIDRVIPVFPTEAAVIEALRGGDLPAPAPETWEAAREETIARWRWIEKLLDDEPTEAVLQELTSMMPICEHAETVYQEQPSPSGARCQCCPVFYELGGRPQDVGCRSVLDPIAQAVRAGDREDARAQVADLIDIVETMPLPAELSPLTLWLPSESKIS